MTYREIPKGSIEIQKGLWLYSYNKTIGGETYTFRQLFASEGYVFYNNTIEVLEGQARLYYVFASLGLTTNVNEYTSIPYQEGMDIAGKKPEIA